MAGLLSLTASPFLAFLAKESTPPPWASELMKGGPKALLGTVVVLAVAQNKDALLRAAALIASAPLRAVARLARGGGGGGGLSRGGGRARPGPPPLARLVEAPPGFKRPGSGGGDASDGGGPAWTDDAHPAAATGAREYAYVRCRHDASACAKQAPAFTKRGWDDALGAVPASCLERWRAAEAERRKNPPSSGGPPPPIRPIRRPTGA